MAAPRCMRSFLGPVKRAKIIQAARPYTHTLSRTKSSKAEADEDREIREDRDGKLMDQLRTDMENGDMTLDQRLQDMGLDPNEYKRLWKSQQAANERLEAWEPRTREEAQQRWKDMQNTPDHLTLLHMYKRAGVEPIKVAKERGITLPTDEPPLDPKTQAALDELRAPINVRAVHLRPLRRTPEHGVPVCDLQLRTYSIRNLLLFADFAVRAAYYMGLAARGPIPLPRITERWTVPRANFIFKKSQENFERVTMRRLIQIQDGHPDVVKAWLAFLQKHQYHGVGMKANIWEYESLDAATRAGYELKEGDHTRRREGSVLQKVDEILGSKGFKEAMKGHKNEVESRP
ncbi:30S ribosomal protein-like protein S10 [Cucurbitaria berberidis CBS 394.84]|uniref:Small ribosomal subunit protein uS10m n=1 Tax=Cucurbitaria berberidis CBS 394.84 TaxID=1168544 RepID=A0A9P4LDK6_9PLEO|nr:30S ribosomal protein-like protein S10 [Cucurbitaria berberidis CBS 394.84]KAF1851120.1 30S ribosomal protein-like protein S10 [Cucurbitaria berberidis CBS 394.84]